MQKTYERGFSSFAIGNGPLEFGLGFFLLGIAVVVIVKPIATFCHTPPYGRRFYRNDKLLFETTVYWKCHNF